MSAWNTDVGAILSASGVVWYPVDSQFAWSPFQDTDTAQVDPTLGGVMTQRSTTAAVASAGFWDMTGANYQSSTALTATVNLANPFLFYLVVDKNNHVGSLNTLTALGSSSNSLAFQTSSTTQPRFGVSMNTGAFSGSYLTQATWSPKGTALVHWIYCNPSDPTNTIQAGVNSTSTTQSGVLTLPASQTLPQTLVFGNTFGTTTGIDSTKRGLSGFISRAGMSFSDSQNIIAAVKSRQGI